jgi:hypothetical protein
MAIRHPAAHEPRWAALDTWERLMPEMEIRCTIDPDGALSDIERLAEHMGVAPKDAPIRAELDKRFPSGQIDASEHLTLETHFANGEVVATVRLSQDLRALIDMVPA